MPPGGAEYNDWDGTAGCLLAQISGRPTLGADVGLRVVDDHIGVLLPREQRASRRFIRLDGFRPTPLQESSQDFP